MNMNRLILTLLCGALLVGGTACSGDDPQPSDKPQPETPGGTDTPDTPGLPTYPKPDRSQIAAFPGAHGAGRYVKGGAEGKVYVVTSLKDDNSVGTLRHAIAQSGPRTIVFAVSGTIDLTSELVIRNGDLTIAGQTAPGDGICLRYHPVMLAADNVIIRFLRFRMGADRLQGTEADGADAIWGKGHRDILIDHCSMSWSTDECASFYDNRNFTMQWCILAESLARSLHDKGAHGYGGIWGGAPATFHHNLLAHHSSRTPRLNGSRTLGNPGEEKADLRNNVFYNWGPTNGGYAGEGGSFNFVNNYYKPGPSTATKKGIVNRIFSPNGDDGKQKNPRGVWGTFHLSGNFFDDSCPSLPSAWKPLLEAVNKNNREGLQPNTGNGVPLPSGGVDALLAAKEFAVSTDAAAFTQSAADAYESVLRLAGASLKRDAVDARIVENVRRGDFTAPGSNGSNYGIIDNEQDVGGWPAYAGTTLKDTDGDGMPDAWEREHGLDPDRDDSAAYNLSREYTNLEVYYNGLVENLYGN